MKTCKKCNKEKRLDEFDVDRGKKDGRSWKCKECRKEHWKQYYKLNKDIVLQKNQEWREENVEQVARTARNWQLRKKYGITVDQYEELLKKQGGKCAICEGEPNGRGGIYFHVDHCHDTLHVRGLLCSLCNTAIGSLRHDPILFTKAIEYLTTSH